MPNQINLFPSELVFYKMFESKIISAEGLKKFKNFVEESYRGIDKQKKEFEDVVSTLKFGKLNEKSRKWAIKVLKGLRVVGVDGSQIKPLREFGIPIGAVQVAAYSVDHGFGKWNVNYLSKILKLEENVDVVRYSMEMYMLKKKMDGKSYLFYDGSFSPSFAKELNPKICKIYLESARKVLKNSEETKTPVFGYTDRSYAKDIAKSFGLDVYDTFLLEGMDFASYTEPMESGNLCYSYVKFSPSLPSRIEFPCWMLKKFNSFIKIVFAECLLGSTFAYPFVLERAHKYAVISEKERRTIVEMIKKAKISFKWISKLR